MLNSSKPVLHQPPCTAASCAPAAQQDEVVQPQRLHQQWSTHKPVTLAHYYSCSYKVQGSDLLIEPDDPEGLFQSR